MYIYICLYIYIYIYIYVLYIYFISRISVCLEHYLVLWQFLLKILHSRNPPNPEPQIPRYKFKSNPNLNLNSYHEITQCYIEQQADALVLICSTTSCYLEQQADFCEC